MYFVLICCSLAILFAWQESRGALRNGLKIGFVIITLVSALRYDYGADYLGYIDDSYLFNVVDYRVDYKLVSGKLDSFSDKIVSDNNR